MSVTDKDINICYNIPVAATSSAPAASSMFLEPIALSSICIFGGLGVGLYFFPASKDDTSQYNASLRHGFMYGGAAVGGIILINNMMNKR